MASSVNPDLYNYDQWVAKSKGLGTNSQGQNPNDPMAPGTQATGRELFGENIDLPDYNRNRSRDFVLEGVADYMKPQYQDARGQYANRGFGRINAPSVQNALYKPLNEQGTRAVREGLTDLYYKDENLAIQKGDYKMRRGLYKEQMKGGKVLCTLMWQKGLLSFDHIKADYRYLRANQDSWFHKDYLRWATKLVDKIKDNDRMIRFILPVVKVWSGYMKAKVEGRRPPLSGFLVHWTGVVFGRFYGLGYRLAGR